MTSLWSDEQEKPLQHLRVIDLSVMLPGPFLTRLLAQYGADVIKIERLPHGDPLREKQDSEVFQLLNQGKRSVAVNLSTSEGISLVKQMVSEADVFVENFREGIMDRLGLGYSDVSEENPDLIYVSIRGFIGKNGVHAGHDFNFIASSGCGEFFLESDPNYSTQFADLIAGALIPALRLLFHLANPSRLGMHLVSHIDENFRLLYAPRAFDALQSENIPADRRKQFGWQRIIGGDLPHSRYYKCRDQKWIALNAVQKKHWEKFCEVVDKPQWKAKMADPTLVSEMQRLFLDAPSTYWEALSTKSEVCLTRVISWGEHLAGSQARTQLGSDPLTWCGLQPNPSLLPAPEMGKDTFSVLHSMGIPNKQIAEWLEQKILHQPESRKI